MTTPEANNTPLSPTNRLGAALLLDQGLVWELAALVDFYGNPANYRASGPFEPDVVSDGGSLARAVAARITRPPQPAS